MLMFYTRDEKSGFRPTAQPNPSDSLLIMSQGFTRADLTHLVDTFGLAKHILNDVFDANELPRVETENGYEYIFLRDSGSSGQKANSHPVLFILGDNLLACLTPYKESTAELLSMSDSSQQHSLRRMLISGVTAVAKNYEVVIDKIGNTVASIEQKMRSHEASNQDFYSFVTIESSLSRSKMSLTGLATVVEKLATTSTVKNERELFNDIQLFSKQLLVEIDSHILTIRSIRETYSTVANNTLNQRMKLLTALTLLLALPNVFYGMYGMNITLPFMHEPWAYQAIVGFTILLIVLVYFIARQKKFF